MASESRLDGAGPVGDRRLWAAGLLLVAVVVSACFGGGVRVEPFGGTPAAPGASPSARAFEGGGTTSDVRYPLEVGGSLHTLIPLDAIKPIYEPTFISPLRETAERTLEFEWTDGRLVDTATKSVWNGGVGIAIEGALAGEALRLLPHSSAFDWARALHHPRSEFYPSLAQ